MRTSQKTMLIAIVLLAVIMVTAIVTGIVLEGNEKTQGPPVSEVLDLAGFDAVTMDGGVWDVMIEWDNDFHMEISYPENTRNDFDIQVRKNKLIVSGPNRLKTSMYKNTLTIRAPSLKFMELDGVSNVTISGFDEEMMEITASGMVNVSTEDSSTDILKASVEGLGNLDLRGISAVDAIVMLDGMGEIFVNMNGGVLEGRLDGMGSVRYKGSVSREEIRVDGWGTVDYKE